jgi:hypothetical protein
MNKSLAIILAATLCGAAQAADPVESLASIDEGESASLDRQSIQAQGGLTRFDVRVAWRDPAQRPAGAAASRIVRYVAQCGQGTLALAAVATLDTEGRMMKSYVVPPGGSEFAAPAAGSREADWIQAACPSR